MKAKMLSPVWWEDGELVLIDQRRLPWEYRLLRLRRVEEVADAIRHLAVRGAPAIGVAAAYGVVLGVREARHETELIAQFSQTVEQLQASRPTAANLKWALERQRRVLEAKLGGERESVVQALLSEAHRIRQEDIEANLRLGEYGAQLLRDGDRVLTHCNTGALATAGWGTALGVIRSAFSQGKRLKVWVDETRPLLQGARLTAWELQQEGIPYEIIVDGAAGALMARGLVDVVITGADRVAANGDTANKIGTYPLAVLSHRHGIPFYVALPTSTIDPEIPDGETIPVEERHPDEITNVYGMQMAPEGAAAKNFAFDVTPHELICAIITETGVLRPPYESSIREALRSSWAIHRVSI